MSDDRRLFNLSWEELHTLIDHGGEDAKYDAEQELMAREADSQESLEAMHDPGYIYDLTHDHSEDYATSIMGIQLGDW